MGVLGKIRSLTNQLGEALSERYSLLEKLAKEEKMLEEKRV